MRLAHALLALALALVVGVPFLLRTPDRAEADGPTETLVIVTPHVSQIRREFEHAFDAWHRREFGTGVRIQYFFLGTSEIRTLLASQFRAAGLRALRDGSGTIVDPDSDEPQLVLPPGAIDFDLMFGGGSYDHSRVAEGLPIEFERDGQTKAYRACFSVPAGFPRDRLDEWYGRNVIGAGQLYADDQRWLGVALSSFGIVYNKPIVRDLLGKDSVDSFDDLADPRLAGWVALADPRLSGSITTTFDSILNSYGWDNGWRVLRGMTANARSFNTSSTKPPMDVSQGEAAAGLAIDFYGRAQAQAITRPGQDPLDSRVGYADPTGTVFIDPDPVSILNGAAHPELAKRFVEFCLTEEGQALWQFRATESGASNPPGPGGEAMGPRQFELRRMPVRRVMYEKHLPYFVDQINPYLVASDTGSKGWRSAIGLMMGAFAVDNAESQLRAWRALARARDDGAATETISRAEALFYAFPRGDRVRELAPAMFPGVEFPPEAFLDFTPENYRAVRGSWRAPGVERRLEIIYTRIFRENYAEVVHLLGRSR